VVVDHQLASGVNVPKRRTASTPRSRSAQLAHYSIDTTSFRASGWRWPECAGGGVRVRNTVYFDKWHCGPPKCRCRSTGDSKLLHQAETTCSSSDKLTI
jgi:hypothetical protein